MINMNKTISWISVAISAYMHSCYNIKMSKKHNIHIILPISLDISMSATSWVQGILVVTPFLVTETDTSFLVDI